MAVWNRALLESTWEAILVPNPDGTAPEAVALTPLSVLLIDPSRYSRAALQALFGEDGRFTVVGETANDGVALVRHLRPTLVLIDPDGEGGFDLDLVEALASAAPESRVCIRTAFFDPKTILRAMEVGALAYLLKGEADPAILLDALGLIGHSGVSVTGPSVVTSFRERQRAHQLRIAASEPENLGLTEREREVLMRLAKGESDEAIAAALTVTKSTVESHVANLRVKLKAETRAHLIANAYMRGVLRLDGS